MAWGLALAGFVALATALLQEPLGTTRLWQEAETFRLSQEYTKAIEVYEELLSRSPRDAFLHRRLGEIYLVQGRYELAEAAFNEARALNPFDIQAFLGAASTALAVEDAGEAIRLLREALGLDPKNAQAHYLLGIIYLKSADLAQAQGELETVLLYAPWDKQSHYYLGLLLALDDLSLASRHLELAKEIGSHLQERVEEMLEFLEALSAEENKATVYARLGEKYLDLDQPTLSQEALRRALGIDPEMILAEAYLGYATLRTGDAESAHDILLAAKAKDAKIPLIHYFLALVYRAQGSLEASKESLEQAIALDPENAAFWTESGLLAWETKDYEGAREAYRKATELEPDQVGFHLLRAEFHLSTLLWRQDGLEAARRAVALAPQNPQAQELLGWAYYLRGDLEQALGPLEQAIRLDPNQASAFYRLGVALARLGRVEEAHYAYQRAVDLATDDFWRLRAKQGLSQLPDAAS